MQEPSEHVVQVVDSLLYRRDSVPNQESSVSSLDDDEYSTLALTAENDKKKKKKKSSLAAKFNDRATNGSLLENKNSLSPSSAASSLRADDESSAGGDQWEAADSDVAKLRRELKDAKMDLEIEKSSKKKREKSLLRLAKELNKRVASEKSKDKKIEELEETIADLQQRLEVKTKMVLKEIPELRARLAEKTKALDDHIAAAQQLESNPVLSGSKKSAFYFLFPLLVLLSACGVGIVIPLAKNRGDFDVWKGAIQNFACSAIPPGMILDTTISQVYSPPFWVPAAYKRSIHAALCAERPFTTVRVDQSKVVVSTDDGKKPATFKAPGGISVGLDARMTLLETKKNKPSRTIPTPWYLEEE